jgi:hypothetical protein
MVHMTISTIGIRHFAECQIFFSRALGKEVFAERRTRQSPTLGNDHVYREQDSRQRKTTLDKDHFAECQTLGERRYSANGHQQPSISNGR